MPWTCRAMRRAATTVACALLATTLCAQPPNYKTFRRDQAIAPTIDANRLLRIWVVYVDQGDGVLIQLPPSVDYDRHGDGQRDERIDILVDGGASPTSESWRMADFLEALYPGEEPIVEHAVISHHDADHVRGLTWLLENTDVPVETIYHNGLASYLPGVSLAGGSVTLPDSGSPSDAIYTTSSGRITRVMALLDGEQIRDDCTVGSLAELRTALDDRCLQGVYADLANAVLGRAGPTAVTGFLRVHRGSDFVGARETASGRDGDLGGVSLEVVWPPAELLEYGGGWGETINGNSVSFRLEYGEFSMLFTGDHNERSEEGWLDMLGDDRSELHCDVLKVPHHGSSHAYEPFFRAADPVVAVASMGEQGFRSKQLSGRNWQHPSEEVISWLGGSHRVYHTLIHERRFRWSDLDTMEKHHERMEYSHVLIETDGTWFRIVEIPDVQTNLSAIPRVQDVRRGNGTRWIRARPTNS